MLSPSGDGAPKPSPFARLLESNRQQTYLLDVSDVRKSSAGLSAAETIATPAELSWSHDRRAGDPANRQDPDGPRRSLQDDQRQEVSKRRAVAPPHRGDRQAREGRRPAAAAFSEPAEKGRGRCQGHSQMTRGRLWVPRCRIHRVPKYTIPFRI